MRLDLGDALSVQGTLKAEVYVKDGDTKLSLSIVADHVLALRHPQKPPAHTHSWGCREGVRSSRAPPHDSPLANDPIKLNRITPGSVMR
jgi:hypothetical protein